MLSFIVPFVISIIFALATIIFSFFALMSNTTNDKYNKFNTMAAISSAIITLISLFYVKIPAPYIYVINENKNELEVEIKSDNFFDTYYTINKSDPENGEKYTAPFTILAPTTVLAKNKFFIWWSEETERKYGDENLSYNKDIQYQTGTQINNNDELNSTTENYNETETQIDEEVNSEIENQPKESEQPDSETESQESEPQTNNSKTSSDLDIEPTPQTPEPSIPNEGLNPSEGSALMTYINQNRVQSGIGELTWNTELEQFAQNIASTYATTGELVSDFSYIMIGRQCNGAKNAQKAVSDWITGNDYIPSEAASLLNADYTQMGGALYYLPNGNQYGYHYFWIVCLR